MRIWSLIAEGEAFKESEVWRINWDAWREFLASGHPDFVSDEWEPWELQEFLVYMRRQKCRTKEQRFAELDEKAQLRARGVSEE